VADGDYYAGKLAPKWRKVGNTLLGGQPAELVANLACEAFAETMRLGNGVPGLTRLCEAFVAAVLDGERGAWIAAADDVRRDAKHHANTEIAAMAGQVLLENHADRLRDMTYVELTEALAEATVGRIAQHHFAKCRQGSLPSTFVGIAELQSRERDAMARLNTAGLAREMLRREDGRGFAAPARETPALGTAALLGQSLVQP
jgi:hypothetical protein